MKCPVCNGLKIKDQKIVEICDFCHGEKDLDWIDSIVGVTYRNDFEKAFDEAVLEIKKTKEEIKKLHKNVNKMFSDLENEMSKV